MLPTMHLLTSLRRADADGDSTMHSSPELDALEDDLFPGDGPSTPRNAASFALASAELSPPNSQGRFQEEGSNQSALAGGAAYPPTINANGKRAHPSSAATTQTSNASSRAADNKAGPVQTDAETGYQWTSAEDAPGYEWKSNRAREDEVRSWDTIVDKGSMIKTKYGDPLKPEVQMGLKR
ncbi:hypothetical protein GRF29_106g434359 [Pseudopithomyces chartarum]|uniref:Uncharacterized protein n=1 Tax=Pseudopithomyces chartarum TaxID=1892770 RepID=A0AAN6REP7_9PLEO|nr:hypothetical protein GRF29_106g434359 [Pseudopithomyces chartarum]